MAPAHAGVGAACGRSGGARCGRRGCSRSSPPAARRRRRAASAAEDAQRGGAPVEGALRRLLDGGPVHHRVGERDADLDGVGAGGGHGPQRRRPSPSQPAGHVGHEQLAAGVAPRRRRRCLERRSLADRAGSITCSASLSPRPDSVTSTVDPAGSSSVPRGARHPGDGVGRLERRDDALGPGQQLQRVEHLVVARRRRSGPGRWTTGGRARGRRRDSRGRPRSSGPRAPGRARPAAGTTSSRARRRARRGRWPRRPRPRRRPAAASVSTKPANVPAAFDPPPTQATT